MSNKFLTTSSVADLSKTHLTCASFSASNLNPSHTLKTDSNRKIVSSALNVGDVTGLQTILNSTITTPFDGTVVASNFETDQSNLNALSTNVSNNTTNIVLNTTTISDNIDRINVIDTDISTIQANVVTNTGDIAFLLANQGLSSIGGKYNQTGPDILVSNTETLTSILNYGAGSTTFTANELQVGSNYHIRSAGRLLTEGKNEGVDFRLELGGNIVHTTYLINLDDVKQILPWELEVDVTVRSTGVSGEISSISQFTYNRNGGVNDYRGVGTYETLSIDTTQSHTFTADVKWNNAFPDNKLIVSQFLITKTF